MARRKRGQQGELFKSEQPRKRPTRFFPLGVPGLRRKGGDVDDEWLNDLKGDKAARVYREMGENQPIIGGTLYVIELLCRQSPYEIKPADDTPEAADNARFAESVIEDMQGGMPGFMTEFLSALQYGWAWMEKIYKIRRGPDYNMPQLHSKFADGRVGIHRIGLIGQETLWEWQWSDDEDVIAMVQRPPPPNSGLRTIPREKALHVRFRYRLNNPEGISILRVPYTSYYYQKNFQFVEAVGIERYLAGYPVMEVPPHLLESDDERDKAVITACKDLVQKIKRDEYEGVVIPGEKEPGGADTGFRLRAFTSGGQKPADCDPVIRRYDARIAVSLLSEFMIVGLDKAGSYSLHSDKTSLFTTALGAVLDERDRQWNEEVFPELMKLNGRSRAQAPYIEHGDVEKMDLSVLASFLQAVTGTGIVQVDDTLEDWTRKMGSLPARDQGPARQMLQQPLPVEESL